MAEKFIDNIISKVFSMKTMTAGLVIFLLGIGAATFIESKYGIQAAKILIYNATWFTILLVFLSLNMISNIFVYRMYKREKMAIFSFHIAFLLIMLGAGITRQFSFEGIMVIKEGETSDFIYTADPHLLVKVQNKKTGKSKVIGKKHYLSEVTHGFGNYFSDELEFENKDITVEYVNFQSKRVDSFQINKKFKNSVVLDIVTEGMTSNYIDENSTILVGNITLGFENKIKSNGIKLRKQNETIEWSANFPIRSLEMSKMREARQTGIEPADSVFKQYELNKWHELKTTTLYQVGNSQFVVKNILFNAKKSLIPSGNKEKGSDYLTVKVYDGKTSKNVTLQGGMGKISTPETISMNGLEYQLEYGSIHRPIPFKVTCRDFQLENYPGTDSPSSFASEVTIIDTVEKKKINKRIFMNHVLDYKGYRFFQSSYTLDDPETPINEEGTILSVNHDFWGTNITYLGYLLMAIGMILSIIAPVGRFRDLNKKLRKIKQKNPLKSMLLFVLFSSIGTTIYPQDHHENDGHNHQNDNKIVRGETFHVISEEHADELATLPVQSFEGRIVPIHTICDQLLRKTYRKNVLEHKSKTYNAVQSIVSMLLYAEYWKKQNTIYIPSVLQKRLKLDKYESYRSISQIDEGGNPVFSWENQYRKAFQTPESDRDEFDKKIIKLHEKFQIAQNMYLGLYLKVIPLKNDANNSWSNPMDINLVRGKDSTATRLTLQYLGSLFNVSTSNDYKECNELLSELKKEQRKVAGNIIPTEKMLDLEVQYNKWEVFKKTYQAYGLIGFLMLIIFFIQIFVTEKNRHIKVFDYTRKGLFIILIGVFAFHASGLVIRWLVSGHVPWSNGYEAVVFIAWVTMLAGFLFSRKNVVVIAGTAVLASLMIFVTELNLLDPEITPLQPVLKSYWLMIHVAVITGSYGFLGLACILGFLNLTLYIFRTQKTANSITTNITELTYISEMTMTIGVFMLTIGTFLGGIWANESWGRYWGWDPKETWALVSVLVYATILHLRFIPGLKSKFVFNLVAFWGYSAILFTFFGVNFVLVGLHSYAQGDGLGDIPNWIWITAIVFLGYSILAYFRNRSYLNSKSI